MFSSVNSLIPVDLMICKLIRHFQILRDSQTSMDSYKSFFYNELSRESNTLWIYRSLIDFPTLIRGKTCHQDGTCGSLPTGPIAWSKFLLAYLRNVADRLFFLLVKKLTGER